MVKEYSDSINICAGVPQDSVLGLFSTSRIATISHKATITSKLQTAPVQNATNCTKNMAPLAQGRQILLFLLHIIAIEPQSLDFILQIFCRCILLRFNSTILEIDVRSWWNVEDCYSGSFMLYIRYTWYKDKIIFEVCGIIFLFHEIT